MFFFLPIGNFCYWANILGLNFFFYIDFRSINFFLMDFKMRKIDLQTFLQIVVVISGY